MSTLTATRPIIAARLRQAVDKSYRHGVLGLRASATWKDGTFTHDGVTVTVAPCPSTLAVWEAIETRDEQGWLVILTPVDEKELGDGVLAHLIDNRLLTPDPWAALRSMFAANTIEPALYRVPDDRGLAVGLLAALSNTAVTPAPGGVLTRDHAMSTLAYATLRVTDDPQVEIDASAVLEWSLRREVSDDLAHLRAVGGAAVAASATAWLAERAGRLGSAVGHLLATDRIGDLVPLGLIAGLMVDKAPGRELARGRFLGRYGLDGLTEADLVNWSEDASGLVIGQLDRVARRVVVTAATALVDNLGIAELAASSELLPHGLSARFDTLAQTITAAIPDDPTAVPTADAVARVDAAWYEVTRHLLAAEDSSLAGAEAAVRLLRWLVEDDDATGGLDALITGHVRNGAWADAALITARRGVEHRGMAEAIAHVIDRVVVRRRAVDRRFAAALADTPQPTGLLVENLLRDIVFPLAAHTPTLLIVVDALSMAAAIDVVAAAREAGWSEATVGGASQRTGALAVLPTLTGRSRCSLLCGQLREGTDTTERSGFLDAIREAGLQAAPGRTDPIFHKKALDTVPTGADLATEVADAIADPVGRRVVAAILNYVDDTLHHTDPGGTDWSLSTITHLRALLRDAQRAGRAVIITSDHGHIIERRDSVKLVRANHYGQRAHGQLDTIGDCEVLVRGPRVLTADHAVVLAVDETIRYGPVNAGYHGGGTPAEAVVPVIGLYTGDVPATFHPMGAVEPSWWHTPVSRGSEKSRTTPTLPTVSTPTLFDNEEPADSPTQSSLAQTVLGTAVFASQWKLAGRIVVSDAQVGALIDGLLATSNREIPLRQAARILGIGESRVTGALLQIKRVLDVEGYEVLALDGPVVRLDEHLLREQFGVGS
ncbi:alkaline phosphatase [Gordonia sp. CNJ-863]|uniref:BREX-2 system phosphatase PglZ n=1 Tax=Gordonia TaxID=2053 RepID=UPI0009699C13|nr:MULTISPECIES: BREX-2 system phosphatase PglZ [Gordonia]MDH3022631.1 BREX-2 system phosphatase PglZ [Gordonia alkanivorans]MDH3026862.1 BREX-2 system phosphatase PglZ [Gordonia alkanivorans]MDJ0010278.1 BREX-2 system phosphatase PglZ [Gordonia alkanivorans]MDJ0100119.1 BREX-2 system phosphatase PglZ [Gordonia alkanivorans]MDJ0495911.1 BREX-2 system phosphatase PglZ [Gordonia alkanivorans]